MPREFDTPVRCAWNPIIKKCLDAVDEHNRLYLKTEDQWHLNQAEILRVYVMRLKVWIHKEEGDWNE